MQEEVVGLRVSVSEAPTVSSSHAAGNREFVPYDQHISQRVESICGGDLKRQTSQLLAISWAEASEKKAAVAEEERQFREHVRRVSDYLYHLDLKQFKVPLDACTH